MKKTGKVQKVKVDMARDTEDLSRLEYARLQADMLAYILDNEATAEDFLRFFARRILELAGCDQLFYRALDGSKLVMNADGVREVEPEICAQCVFSDVHNRVYDLHQDRIEIDDTTKGVYGIVPPAECPVKSAYSYRVLVNGRLNGYLAVHYIRERHALADSERKMLEAIVTMLGLSLSRLEKKHWADGIRHLDAEFERERHARESCERMEAALKLDFEAVEQALQELDRPEVRGNPRPILEIVRRRYDAQCCYLYEWDPESNCATIRKNWMTADGLGDGPWKLELTEWQPKLASHAARKISWYDRAAATEILFRHFGAELARRLPFAGTACLYAVPIIVGSKVWGCLVLLFADDRKLTPHDGETLRRLSDVLAVDYERDMQARRLLSSSTMSDQMLSTITKQLYGYNLTVSLADDTFSMITGSGMDALVQKLASVHSYRAACEIMLGMAKAEYRDRLRQLISLDYLLNAVEAHTEREMLEYGFWLDDEERWAEVNIVIAQEGGDRSVVNILGRDITEARKVQLLHERELKAAVVKDQILSGITQTLYGFDLTVNLKANTYTLIKGTGAGDLLRILEREGSTYSQAVEGLVSVVPEVDRVRCRKFVGRDYLLGLRGKSGFIGMDTFKHLSEDGAAHWCEVNVFMGTDENGDPVANILGRDVTEMHEQQDRRVRELKAAAAKDQVLSGITRALYGYNLMVNLKTLKYTLITGTGMEPTCELFKRHDDYAEALEAILKLVDAQYAPHVASILAPQHLCDLAAVGRSGSIGSFEYAATINGQHRWHEANIFIGTDENGDPVANILGRNITEAREQQDRRERELKAAAAKDQVLSGITQALYGYNLTVNLKTLKYTLITGTGMEATCELFKRHDDYAEALKEKLKIVDAADRVKVLDQLSPEHFRKLAAKGQSGAIGSFEYAANVNGETQWHEMNVFIGTDESGDPVANILGRNITETRRQAEVQQQLLVAQRSNEAKSTFLFSMSHDIRTPMNAILGFVAMARKLAGDNRPLLECLGKVDLAGKHLLSLINAVLEMSRIESGAVVLKPRPCNVVDEARKMMTVAEPNAAKRGLAFTLKIGEIRHPQVSVDLDRVNQVVQNILGNAIKYTPAGGSIVYELSERPTQRLGYALYVIRITDTGIGMSPEFLKNVFEPFAREQTSTVSGIEGTGLGLSIVRRIVDMMGGTIDIVSEQNKGTTVTIGIPAKWETKVGVEPESRPVQEALRLDGMRILLVEDNEMNREIANWMLSEMGAEIVEAENGREAVERVAADGAIDLVLMDVQMPVMDGYEATRAIRQTEWGRALPIIALSANAFEEDRRRSREMGMDDHIAKPINAEELSGTLSRHIVISDNGRRFCRSLETAESSAKGESAR